MQLDVGHRHQRALPQFVIVAQLGMIVAQKLADPRPRLGPDLRPERHEGIERGAREHAERADIEPGILFELPEIEHVIADRDTDARGETVLRREHAVGQVLDREVGGGGDGDKGAEAGVVGMNVTLVSFFLPFSPCGRRWREAPDEGFSQLSHVCAETDPISIALIADRHPLPSSENRLQIDHSTWMGEGDKKDHGLFGSNRFSRPFQQSA